MMTADRQVTLDEINAMISELETQRDLANKRAVDLARDISTERAAKLAALAEVQRLTAMLAPAQEVPEELPRLEDPVPLRR